MRRARLLRPQLQCPAGANRRTEVTSGRSNRVFGTDPQVPETLGISRAMARIPPGLPYHWMKSDRYRYGVHPGKGIT
jgi:hypothetical protein